MADLIRCYVCGERVPKSRTDKLRHRVPSGAVNTRSAFTYRMVRKCVPYCGAPETVPTVKPWEPLPGEAADAR